MSEQSELIFRVMGLLIVLVGIYLLIARATAGSTAINLLGATVNAPVPLVVLFVGVAVVTFPELYRLQSGGAGSPTETPVPTAVTADACIQGYVWREAFSGDHVCVTSEERERVRVDNAAAATRIDPNGAYGPDSCIQGFVWRGARPADHVCVTSEERDRVAADNAAAAQRIASP